MVPERIPEFEDEVFLREFTSETIRRRDDMPQEQIAAFCRLVMLFGSRKVMDIPCGIGREVYYFALGCPDTKFVGIDNYKPAIDFARENYPLRHLKFAVEDIYDLEKGRTADLVRIGYSLHHLEPERAFASVRNVLPKGGKLVIGDFNREATDGLMAEKWISVRTKLGDGYPKAFAEDSLEIEGRKIPKGVAMYLDSRIAAYTKDEICEAAEKAGFAVLMAMDLGTDSLIVNAVKR